MTGRYCLRASAALALLCCAFIVSVQAQTPSGCAVPPPAPKLDASAPINIGLLKLALIRYRCMDYDNEVAATLAEAKAWVAQRAPAVSKPAIVLDIDETALSNWEQIHHNDFGYIRGGSCDLKSTSACGQRDWELSASATALKPTLELYTLAKTIKGKDGAGVAVFFVTGRPEDPFQKSATEWNLRKAGYDGWTKLVMRSEGQPTADFKSKARQAIEAEGYTIVANIGDQFSDLVGEYAERCFKVPNPFYFIPGGTIPEGGLACLRR